MERRGAVNIYTPFERDSGRSAIIKNLRQSAKQPAEAAKQFFTLNLANGVTPFIMHFGGVECCSNNYVYPQGVQSVFVQIAFYRPTKAVFDTFDDQVKQHVLNGGLVPVNLAIAAMNQLPNDPVEADMDFETVQGHFLTIYGVRLKPLTPPVG